MRFFHPEPDIIQPDSKQYILRYIKERREPMPPKTKITREMVIAAAFEVAREAGAEKKQRQRDKNLLCLFCTHLHFLLHGRKDGYKPLGIDHFKQAVFNGKAHTIVTDLKKPGVVFWLLLPVVSGLAALVVGKLLFTICPAAKTADDTTAQTQTGNSFTPFPKKKPCNLHGGCVYILLSRI